MVAFVVGQHNDIKGGLRYVVDIKEASLRHTFFLILALSLSHTPSVMTGPSAELP